MKFVVIIPTYNEKDNVEKAVSILENEFQKIQAHEFHILITDANSPDGTADVVREQIKKYKNVHLIVEKEKRGIGAAYIDAMDFAFDIMNADVIITFDCDLSHDASVLPQFVEKIENGADQVIGTRYREGGSIPKEWGLHRKFLSVFGNKFISVLYFGTGVTDFTGGYKTIRKNVYKDIRDSVGKHKGYTSAISMNLEPIRKGYKIEEVPFHFVDRTVGESKMGAEYAKNAMIFLLRSRFIDFYNSRFGKVFIAGGLGATAQLISYRLTYQLAEVKNIFSLLEVTKVGPFVIYPQLFVAHLIAIEVGIITSYTINNSWAFKDKKLHGLALIFGFLKNQIVVIVAIFIQLIIVQVLAHLFGIGLFRNYIYQIIGIFVGLFWNFYFYKKIIWKVRK